MKEINTLTPAPPPWHGHGETVLNEPSRRIRQYPIRRHPNHTDVHFRKRSKVHCDRHARRMMAIIVGGVTQVP